MGNWSSRAGSQQRQQPREGPLKSMEEFLINVYRRTLVAGTEKHWTTREGSQRMLSRKRPESARLGRRGRTRRRPRGGGGAGGNGDPPGRSNNVIVVLLCLCL